jgi:hypothetical protein
MAKKISSSDLFEQEDIFRGIKESANEAINKLEQLELSLKGIAQATEPLIKNANFGTTKGIKEFTDATQKAEAVSKEFLAVEKEKQTLRKAQAQAEQAEIKAKKERIALEQKETAIANKLSRETANKTSAYKQLEANTRALKNQSKELGAQLLNLTKNGQQNTAEFAKLEQQYKEVTASAQAGDAELKQLDKTIGDNFRNVGNYESATKSLKTELRELTQALANMESSDPRFQEMANRAGELRDRMQDAKAVVQATAGSAVENLGKSFARAGQIGVAGVQGLTAGMQLLGVENEDTLKQIAKLQALAGLADSLSVLGGLGDAFTEIKAGITSAALKMGILTTARVADTTATGAQIVATEAEAVATAEATTAQLAFNTAILTNPYVLAIAGITALVGAIVYFTSMTGKSEKAQKAHEEQMKRNAERMKRIAQESRDENKAITDLSNKFVVLVEQLKQTNRNSEQREKLMKQINAQYGTTFTNLSTETEFQKQLNIAVAEYIRLSEQKYLIQRNEEKINKIREKQFNQLDDLNKEYATLKQNFSISAEFRNLIARSAKGDTSAQIELQNKLGQKYKDANVEKSFEYQILTKLTNKQKQYNSYIETSNNWIASLSKQSVNAQSNISELTDNGQKYVETQNGMGDKTDAINTKFETQNDLISKQRELLEQLREAQQTETLAELQRGIDYQLTAEKKAISKGADAQVDALEKLVFERFAIEQGFLKEREKNELESLEIQYQREKELRKKALDDQKAELIKGANGNATAIAEIDKNYQTELEKLNANEAVLYNDLQLEKQVVNEKYKDESIKIKKAEGNEINRVNDEIFEAQKQYSEKSNKLDQKDLDNLKKTESQKREIIKMTSEFFVKQSEKRIDAIDKEINKAQQQYDYLKGLAEAGNIDAQQSLAEQQKIINDANLRKERELKRQQRIKLAESVYSTYSQKVESGSKNPLAETIRDTTLLTQFINSLPTFFDGTEDTGTNGRGIDGRGGFHAVLHPNERVIPKSLNEQIGAMSNEDLARIAQEHQNNKNFGGVIQSHSSLELALLVNEIKDLKTIIKDKPETNIELGEITSGAMEIVKKIKQGNTTTYNRYKIK